MSYLKLRPDRVAMQDATAQVMSSLKGVLTLNVFYSLQNVILQMLNYFATRTNNLTCLGTLFINGCQFKILL